MFLLLPILTTHCLPSVLSLDCLCSLCDHPVQFCAGDYCSYRIDSGSDKINTGCITPREDVWKDKTLPHCERNQYNSTLCICNNADKCNTIETFSKRIANDEIVTIEAFECINSGAEDMFPRPPCSSSICVTIEERKYDEFFDLVSPPYTRVDRLCPEYDFSPKHKTFSIDIDCTSPPPNSCIHIRYGPTQSTMTCHCNSTETTKCWGDYCYWSEEEQRGCIDAAGAGDNFRLRVGESAYNDKFIVICEGDYCNSDFQYPNGTVVGPSAYRRFTSSFAISPSLISLVILPIAKIFL